MTLFQAAKIQIFFELEIKMAEKIILIFVLAEKCAKWQNEMTKWQYFDCWYENCYNDSDRKS